MDEARHRAAERRVWASLGAEPTEEALIVEGRRLRVQVVGDGPPLLFLHGGGISGTSWAPLAAQLTDHRCLLVDRAGCGLSEAPSGRFDDVDAFLAHATDFVPAVLDALAIDRAPVVATSFGALYGVRAAARHPDRVDGLLLFAWPFGTPIEKIPLVMRIATTRPLGAAMRAIPPSPAMTRSILRQIGLGEALDSGRMSEEMFEWFRSVLRDTDTTRNQVRTLPPVLRPVRGINREVLFDDELLASIDVPVAVVWGTADPMGGEASARTFATRIPNATLDVWEGVGHAPYLDDPQRAASVVADFTR